MGETAEPKADKTSLLGKMLNIVVVLFVLFSAGVLANAYFSKGEGSFLGYRGFIVLTGSMSPTFNAGSYIIVKETEPEDIQVGDILTYKVEAAAVLTHRVVEIAQEDGARVFLTQGDANNTPDVNPVTQERIVGVAVFWVNGLGYLFVLLQQPRIFIAVFALLCVVVIIVPYAVRLLGDKKEEKEDGKEGKGSGEEDERQNEDDGKG